MFWFFRNKHKEMQERQQKEVSIEVRRHKQKRAKVVARTQNAADELNEVLARNNITISIHRAAGGRFH